MNGLNLPLEPAGAALATDPLSQVIETDRVYFELGAQRERIWAAELAWMPGLVGLSAAIVAHRIEAPRAARLGAAWLRLVERQFAHLGAPTARLYLDDENNPVAPLLAGQGYFARREIAFVTRLPPPRLALRLHRLVSAADWRRKRDFHRVASEAPDGHRAAAEAWTELERRKSADGLRVFLAEFDGTAVATAGIMVAGDMLRLKNLVVHPGFRRQGIASDMLRHLATWGESARCRRQCLFAVEGTASERLYRRLGFEEVGCQVEWTRPLP